MAIENTSGSSWRAEEPSANQVCGREWEAVKRDMCHDLSQVQGPMQFLQQLAYATPILVSIRIMQETGVFRHLVNAGRPLTIIEIVTEAAGHSGNDFLSRRDFTVRHLRFLCALHFVDEVEIFTYQANAMTQALTSGLLTNSFPLVFDGFFGPSSTMVHAFESATRGNHLQAPKDALTGPFQLATLSTGTSTFDYWQKHQPEQLLRLSKVMAHVKKNEIHWTEWLPSSAMNCLKHVPLDGQRVTWVDVGGGLGQDIERVATSNPDMDVRLVLQDLPGVIAEGCDRQKPRQDNHAEDNAIVVWDDRIEAMPYNFFDPQPIKNAEVYFMHRVLHDWSDVECVKILSHIRDAMGTRSRILNCDHILPNEGCSVIATALDMSMLMFHSGLERDEDMWTRLIDKVDGLRIRNIYRNPHVKGGSDGVIEIVRTDFVE